MKEVVQNKGYDKIISSTSGFGKDVVPRLGGLLDVQPITDVIQISVSIAFICQSITIINQI